MSLEPRDLATDVERDQAIAALRHHTAAGLLSLDDFAEGVERVLLAETRADLVPITANLPAIPEPSAPPRELPRRWAVGVLSGERVRGPWRLDDHLHAVACLGSVEVDLCDALVERRFALLHECRVLVPQLKMARTPESPSAEAERLLYYALAGAIEAGLVRTAEDVLRVLRQAPAAWANGGGVAEAAGAAA